jgi:DNA-binding transcriptional LysR family regulator
MHVGRDSSAPKDSRSWKRCGPGVIGQYTVSPGAEAAKGSPSIYQTICVAPGEAAARSGIVTARTISPGATIHLAAATLSVGVAVQPEFLVWDDFAAGRLEAVMTEWSMPPIALNLITPLGGLRPARVRR